MNQISYRNNWGADEYSVGSDRIATLDFVGINGIIYAVTARICNISYNDMGRTYSVESTHYFVKEKVFGLTKEFDLNEIVGKVKVVAVEFTLEKR